MGAAGLGAELVLLEHTEEFWQWVPVVLLGSALALLPFLGRAPGRRRLIAWRILMVGFCAAGVLGVVLHLKGNLEFEMELHPDAAGWGLISEVLRGATPALSPGAMAFLGMLGLAFVRRRPADLETENHLKG